MWAATFTILMNVLIIQGQTTDQCQNPGNAVCYLSEFDMIVGGLCCPGYACLPYPGDPNNFCQQMQFLGEGEYCGVSHD